MKIVNDSVDGGGFLVQLLYASAQVWVFLVCSEAQKCSALEMEVHKAPSPQVAQGTERTACAPAQATATQAGEEQQHKTPLPSSHQRSHSSSHPVSRP
jgi:hypothetical protein